MVPYLAQSRAPLHLMAICTHSNFMNKEQRAPRNLPPLSCICGTHALASEDFQKENLSDVITVTWRDVCANGFGIEGKADAVFLDLPSPWEAIPHATTALKWGGNICAYTPCIEQVQRVCDSLRERKYTGWSLPSVMCALCLTLQFFFLRYTHNRGPLATILCQNDTCTQV